jgi:hypothetical protein
MIKLKIFFGKTFWNLFLFHYMKQIETNLVQKSSKIFICELCNYNTSRFSQYERHITTAKHINRLNETNMKQI